MPITVILAAAALAASLPLLWWAAADARDDLRTVDRDRLAVPRTGADARTAALTLPARQRFSGPVLGALAGASRRLSPPGWVDALERRWTLAGRPPAWPVSRLLAVSALAALTGAALGGLWWLAQPSTGRALGAVALAALAAATPDLLLRSKARERQQAIGAALPDTLDQLTIAVEAGLGFDAAMARTARAGSGPLVDELAHTLQEVSLGVSRTEAMRSLADRTEQPDLRRFVLAVVQADAHGVPIADVLRTQAAEQRLKRRQRAEERAMKIPVKIVFPLILCILPTIFIVILGPAVIQVSRTLFGEGGAL